jgi:hypothetical protein
MAYASLSSFKRGDTFMLECTHRVNGIATAVSGLAIRSQIRTSTGELVAVLESAVLDQGALPGQFVLSPVNANTSAWPVGTHRVDIEVINAGVIRSTKTFLLPVEEDSTT